LFDALRSLDPIVYDGRVRCPYCLGAFERDRADRLWCTASCKMAAGKALAAESSADLPMASQRNGKASAERRRVTGYATVSPQASFMADLRVRALALGELHTRRQLHAALEWVESVERVSRVSGVPLADLEALGVDVEAAVQAVAWVRA